MRLLEAKCSRILFFLSILSLIRETNLFTFKVTINKYGLSVAILKWFSGYFILPLFLSSSLAHFLFELMISCNRMFGVFLIYLFISTVDFCFMVTVKLT